MYHYHCVSNYPSTDALSVDKHLKLVREATWDVRAQWYRLGGELNVSNGTLKVRSIVRSFSKH